MASPNNRGLVSLSDSLWAGTWISIGILSFSFLPKEITPDGQDYRCCVESSFYLFFVLLRPDIGWSYYPYSQYTFIPLHTTLHRYFLMGSALISVLLCLDDWEFATGYHKMALEIQTQNVQGSRSLAGHWGLQWYLEEQGFVPAENDQPFREDWLVHVQKAWPQEGSQGTYLLQQSWSVENQYPGPTVLSIKDKSHYHANMIAPNIQTYASWGWERNLSTISLCGQIVLIIVRDVFGI